MHLFDSDEENNFQLDNNYETNLFDQQYIQDMPQNDNQNTFGFGNLDNDFPFFDNNFISCIDTFNFQKHSPKRKSDMNFEINEEENKNQSNDKKLKSTANKSINKIKRSYSNAKQKRQILSKIFCETPKQSQKKSFKSKYNLDKISEENEFISKECQQQQLKNNYISSKKNKIEIQPQKSQPSYQNKNNEMNDKEKQNEVKVQNKNVEIIKTSQKQFQLKPIRLELIKPQKKFQSIQLPIKKGIQISSGVMITPKFNLQHKSIKQDLKGEQQININNKQISPQIVKKNSPPIIEEKQKVEGYRTISKEIVENYIDPKKITFLQKELHRLRNNIKNNSLVIYSTQQKSKLLSNNIEKINYIMNK